MLFRSRAGSRQKERSSFKRIALPFVACLAVILAAQSLPYEFLNQPKKSADLDESAYGIVSTKEISPSALMTNESEGNVDTGANQTDSLSPAIAPTITKASGLSDSYQQVLHLSAQQAEDVLGNEDVIQNLRVYTQDQAPIYEMDAATFDAILAQIASPQVETMEDVHSGVYCIVVNIAP